MYEFTQHTFTPKSWEFAMRFAWKFRWTALLFVGLVSSALPVFAEEEPAAEAEEVQFAPKDFSTGYAQILAYRNEAIEDKVPAAELYPKCAAMIDKLWEMDLEFSQYRKLLQVKAPIPNDGRPGWQPGS